MKKGCRQTALVSGDSDIVRRKKEAQRNRRLRGDEGANLLKAAGDHLKDLILAALETCCRLGELLSLQWLDVSMDLREIVLRAHKTKDREDRAIPMSSRLHAVLEMRRTAEDGKESARSGLAPYRRRLAGPSRPAMLGHATLQQTSPYLNATLRGLHDSMRNLEQARAACNPVASEPQAGDVLPDPPAAIH